MAKPAPKIPKIILITGCSSGFGLLMAARLTAEGHQVIATMRHLAKKQPLTQAVAQKGGEVDLQMLDVTKPPSIQHVMMHIQETYGHLDVLINNAGYGLAGYFEDLDNAEIRAIMETNFFGVMNVTRAALPLMHQSPKDRKHKAKIINISSISGFTAYPCFGAYNQSKWALEAFSESLMYELRPFDIQVLLVQPGSYRTEIFYANRKYAKRFNDPDSRYYRYSAALKNYVDAHLNKNKRDPDEVARLVARLVRHPHPPFRTIPDFPSRVLYWLRKFLPFRLYSFLTYTVSRLALKKYAPRS
jgi:NAD(P)-dependent dehydrogenase (short-subunit alcohol dehydrogenase family)